MTTTPSRGRRRAAPDTGAVLPIVLVVSFVMGSIVAALATYATTTLRHGSIVEERADRLAAAEAGMRDMFEKIDLGRAVLCVSAPTTFNLIQAINGATVSSTCAQVGSGLTSLDGWAVIITGEGVANPNDYFLHTQAGNASTPKKRFQGPVFMQGLNTSRAALQSKLEIENGDIYYHDPTCTADPTRTALGDTINNLSFLPLGRGTYCLNADWHDRFDQPPVPGGLTNNPRSSTPNVVGGDCMVFDPGFYEDDDIVIDGSGTNPDNYYFRSGVYYFEDVTITVDTAAVWAGFPGPGDSPEVDNAPCADVQAADTGNGTGASFYMGGDSSLAVLKGSGAQPGAFEIFRRINGDYAVSVQALCDPGDHSWCASGGGDESDLGPYDVLLSSGTGNNKQLVIHGLAWGPEAAIEFGLVTNQAQGQLLGGAVFATFDVGASANASGFVVSGSPAPGDGDLLIETTATKNGRSTTIESVVEYRPLDTDIEYAVTSYRVVE